MKKVLLLCALVCAGQMYGMETKQPEPWNFLPREVQVLVIQALNTGGNADEIVHAIMSASRTSKALNQIVNEVYHGNLKRFTALVDLLAKKFPELTKWEIADKFNTPIAKQYKEVNKSLIFAIAFNSPLEEVIPLLNQGADANLYTEFPALHISGTPLSLAVIRTVNPDLVKLLLNSGANPFSKLPINGLTALDIVSNFLNQENRDETLVDKAQIIKTLLENAMKK